MAALLLTILLILLILQPRLPVLSLKLAAEGPAAMTALRSARRVLNGRRWLALVRRTSTSPIRCRSLCVTSLREWLPE